ncbi:hypothetical protein [Sphingomonas glaciei]|uniref:MarR family transcriptional regulator n=1 Tax=Sphingomonas glaciei TaxID=2938948 RepID=A0ABY5MUM2_9SPHN|nr:hypothetical protein [Sphingomonas glaciei]UUR08142.1 hypothetical protein M1K48_00375 [Sphingomonas glaciei]
MDISRGTPEPDLAKDEAEMLRIAAAELYAMRRRRDKHIPCELLGEPVWDMLLASYAHRENVMSIPEVCHFSAVSQSTGHRWLRALISKSLVEYVRSSLDSDQDCNLVALTKDGRAMVEEVLRDMLRG